MSSPTYRFAIFDLDSCLAVAKAAHDLGGVASTEELADKLGYKSANNGSFNTRLANTRLFGLLEGSASSITPSDRARSILFPDYPETEARARLAAFEAVPLYKTFLDAYHGQPLPDDAGLRNALATRFGINEDKVPVVLARMLDSAEEAGLFSAAGGRTKMIRPTLRPAPGSREPNLANETLGPREGQPQPQGPRANKVIDGVLDLLPTDPKGWDEAGFLQWLSFFEGALRLYYGLGATRTGQAARPGGGSP